jgi:hypothetical protein
MQVNTPVPTILEINKPADERNKSLSTTTLQKNFAKLSSHSNPTNAIDKL